MPCPVEGLLFLVLDLFLTLLFEEFPPMLRAVLEDRNIVKVGVGIQSGCFILSTSPDFLDMSVR